MKFKVLILLFISMALQVALVSCGGEEAGASVYFLDNQSSINLISKNWGIQLIVNSNEILEIGGAGMIGGNPGIGGNLILYRDSLGNEIVAYEQIPIDESLWLAEVIDNSQYGSVYYTLIMTDDMIK